MSIHSLQNRREEGNQPVAGQGPNMTLLVVSAEDWLSSVQTGVFTRLSSTQDLLGRDASEGGGGAEVVADRRGQGRGAVVQSSWRGRRTMATLSMVNNTAL
ncbi:unnamed protein product [Arctogadus glacialis]